MSKLLWIVIILVILTAGGYYLTKSGTPAVTPQPSSTSNAQNTTINYSGSGFDPQRITVKAGTTIVWKNNDTDPMMIDSDPHPTHTSYPPLNASKATISGNTYTFTFTDPGTYGYHNHLKAQNRGTVIVQ